jgi:alkanesulfonate monooxygenase SsuD/methylene tetrahydromethanopterin reductase-like flavin-dependent oxidoreductase (luciferase family)
MPIRPPSPVDFSESPLAQIIKQPMLLGLFLPIQSGGWSPSSLPRSTSWDFDYNARLTQRAEELGFDLVFGLAQWMGKGGTGGAIHFREQSLDPFITATSLAAITKRIILISTIHVLYGSWHPLYLAKFGATIDHISGGRWGLNVVTGFVPSEARMFGNEQIAHDARYEMAGEFTSLMEALWASSENLTSTGRYWRLIDAYVTPKPRFGRPLLVNATGSPAGIAYAARHSDLVFITSPGGGHFDAAIAALPQHNAEIKAKAAEFGREVKTIINPMIICRRTNREAHEYYDSIVAAADVEAIEGFVGRRMSGDAKGWKTDLGAYRAVGGNMQIVGSPAEIVERFLQLKQAGCDGVQLTFFDFAADLEIFGQEVLPLMKQAGLRLGT